MTLPMTLPLQFIYRNRSDDTRLIDELHFCASCGGWYGVPHTHSHCQQGQPARWNRNDCACRFCKEATNQPIIGSYGEIFPEQPLDTAGRTRLHLHPASIVNFVTHKVRIQEQTTREITVEIILAEGSKANPEQLALEHAKRYPRSLHWKSTENIVVVADTESGITDLIDYEEELDDRFGFFVSSKETPDGIRRSANVYEVAQDPGTYRIRVHESVNWKETWYGGRTLYEHDTKSWRSAKMLARKFVRRGFTPDGF